MMMMRELNKYLDTYFTPWVQPGKGSLRVLETTVGRMMMRGMVSFKCPKIISPIAFVNEYVFGHPCNFALSYLHITVKQMRQNQVCRFRIH